MTRVFRHKCPRKCHPPAKSATSSRPFKHLNVCERPGLRVWARSGMILTDFSFLIFFWGYYTMWPCSATRPLFWCPPLKSAPEWTSWISPAHQLRLICVPLSRRGLSFPMAHMSSFFYPVSWIGAFCIHFFSFFQTCKSCTPKTLYQFKNKHNSTYCKTNRTLLMMRLCFCIQKYMEYIHSFMRVFLCVCAFVYVHMQV